MARKNVSVVFEAFLKGEATNRNKTISTDGRTIYSYSTPIAWGVFDESGKLTGLEISGDRWTVTTTQQQNGLRSLAEGDLFLKVSTREVSA